MPKDADAAPDRADALRRILAMNPHDVGSTLIVDEALRAELVEAAAEK